MEKRFFQPRVQRDRQPTPDVINIIRTIARDRELYPAILLTPSPCRRAVEISRMRRVRSGFEQDIADGRRFAVGLLAGKGPRVYTPVPCEVVTALRTIYRGREPSTNVIRPI